jgi:hypothetical protein
MEYLDCMETGCFGEKKVKKLIGTLDTIADAIEATDAGIEVIDKTDDVLEVLAEGQGKTLEEFADLFDDVADPLEELGPAVKKLKAITKLGASASRGDALHFVLTAGSLAAPPGVDQFFEFYAEAYDAIVGATKKLTYSANTRQKIQMAQDSCIDKSCPNARNFLQNTIKDKWHCRDLVAEREDSKTE